MQFLLIHIIQIDQIFKILLGLRVIFNIIRVGAMILLFIKIFNPRIYFNLLDISW